MKKNYLKSLEDFDCLVLSGGGIRGIGLCGGLDVFDEHGCLANVDTFIGTSMGALICCVLAIGFECNELYPLFCDINWKDFSEIKVSNFIKSFGLDNGSKIMGKIRKLFCDKKINPNITFSQLYELNGNQLIVTGVCVEEHTVKFFNKETSPDLKILDAVRISISIPYLFTSPIYKDKHYVDGGLLDNFPTDCIPNGKTALCIKLNHSYEVQAHKKIKIYEGQIDQFSLHLVYTLIDENQRLRTKLSSTTSSTSELNKNIYVIEIVTDNISSVDMKLDEKQKEYLYECGRHYAAVWLEKKIEKIRETKWKNLEKAKEIDNSN